MREDRVEERKEWRKRDNRGETVSHRDKMRFLFVSEPRGKIYTSKVLSCEELRLRNCTLTCQMSFESFTIYKL